MMFGGSGLWLFLLPPKYVMIQLFHTGGITLKKLLLALLMMSIFTLAACSSSDEKGTETKKDDGSKTEEEQSVGVDKGIFNVEVTLPAEFFEGEDIDQAIADAKADGIKEATKNPDGSVTYKMSKEKHKEMMKEMEDGIKESMNEMANSEDYSSISEVTVNEDYNKFTLIVDKAAYENSFDSFAAFGLGMIGMYYQVFDGKNADEAKVEINVQDATTKEILNTTVFPDDMEEEESNS